MNPTTRLYPAMFRPGRREAAAWLSHLACVLTGSPVFFYVLFSALLLAALWPGLVNSQTSAVPDAGSIRQQIERPRSLLPPPAAPQRAAPPPEIRPPQGMSVAVKAFRFVGNTLVSADGLTESVAPFTGQTLDFQGLQRAADAVATAYREAGWIVRVYLPEQDVTEGLITLQIVEGRFAGVRFDGQQPGLVSAKQIAAIFQARQRVGEPLSSISLDRALLLSDDLPGVSVAGTLVPGEADAETALVLQTTDEPPLYGDVTVDNTGSRATGSERLAANVSFNSPWGGGELLSVNALRTRGSEYGRIAMTAPVGNDGLRLGFSLSSLNYHVVEGLGSQAAAPVRGESDSVGLDLSYPVWRSRLSNLYLLSGVEQKSFINRDTLIRSDYSSVSLRIGLSGNAFDSVGGGGANSASLQWVGGHLTDMVAHSQFDTIDRRYEKLVFGISRQQAVSDEHSLFVSLSGQHAVQGLDSSEKFFIGGSNSVRAYPASELGGERGQVLTGEWRWRPMPVLAVTGFIDVGRVLALPVVEGNPQVRSVLRGKGLAVAWQGPHGLTPKLTWSRREGLNPRPTPSGADSDGTLKLDRFWLSLTLTF